VAVVEARHAGVVGHDAGLHLRQQLPLKAGQRRQTGRGIGVFGPEVAHHLGTFAARVVVAQPVVLVDPVAMRTANDVFDRLGHRRPGLCRRNACGGPHTTQDRDQDGPVVS